jgi:hypothetical protein
LNVVWSTGGKAECFVLNMSGDGVVLGKLNARAPSCWILGAMRMNLPPWLRAKAGFMHISSDMTGTDVQAYLEIAADELAHISTAGFEVSFVSISRTAD